MKVLIKNATLISPSTPFHGTTQDIFIDNGVISKIGNELTADAVETVEIKGLHISSGWVDCFADFCDPGKELKKHLKRALMRRRLEVSPQ